MSEDVRETTPLRPAQKHWRYDYDDELGEVIIGTDDYFTRPSEYRECERIVIEDGVYEDGLGYQHAVELAHLFAASPKLYAALERLVAACGSDEHEQSQARSQAITAIALARGEI